MNQIFHRRAMFTFALLWLCAGTAIGDERGTGSGHSLYGKYTSPGARPSFLVNRAQGPKPLPRASDRK